MANGPIGSVILNYQISFFRLTQVHMHGHLFHAWLSEVAGEYGSKGSEHQAEPAHIAKALQRFVGAHAFHY